jgi:hypothetical protein
MAPTLIIGSLIPIKWTWWSTQPDNMMLLHETHRGQSQICMWIFCSCCGPCTNVSNLQKFVSFKKKSIRGFHFTDPWRKLGWQYAWTPDKFLDQKDKFTYCWRTYQASSIAWNSEVVVRGKMA